jgi:hypothetical protein
LTSLVVGGSGKTKGLPDACNLGGTNVGFSNDGKIESDRRESFQITNFIGFLICATHLVAKSVLVETLLKADLGNALFSTPEIIETNTSSTEQTEI